MENKKALPVILLNMAVDIHNERECEILISQYAQRVCDAGAVPMLMPSIENEDMIETLLDLADGVLLIGGKDYHPSSYGEQPHPETSLARMRPDFDIRFARAVLQRDMPVLGICAGCQLLNIVTGGKLIQHLNNAAEHRFTEHEAEIVKTGFFSSAISKEKNQTFTVNSFHHQALDPEHLGCGVEITAVAFDGSVEAIEIPGDRMILGVQFHPERMDDLAPLCFGALVREAQRFRTR